MARGTEQVVTVNGIRTWTALQGQGFPMVLCHGGPGAYDYLKPVADMVDDLCMVLRYDQRGGGRSDALPPYTVATLVDDLEGLRTHFGFESWIVAGHSWGAGLALAYAARYPTRTRALIHSGGTGIDPEWHRDYLKNRLARLSDTDRQEFERLTALRDGAAGADRAELQSRLMKISRKIDVFDPAFADALPTFDEYPISDEVNRLLCADWQAYMRDPPFRDSVFNLTMPVLFFDGAGDVQPAKFIAALADSIAGSRLVIVPQAGHHTWVEQPAFVRAALREFVASLP